MFIFGVDIPLPEVLFVLALLSIFIVVLLIWVLYDLHKVNRKFRAVIKELHLLRKKLADMHSESNKDLRLLVALKRELDIVLRAEQKELKAMKNAKGYKNLKVLLKDVTKRIEKKVTEMGDLGIDDLEHLDVKIK